MPKIKRIEIQPHDLESDTIRAIPSSKSVLTKMDTVACTGRIMDCLAKTSNTESMNSMDQRVRNVTCICAISMGSINVFAM